MDRSEALALLGTLIGSDLVDLGNKYGVTIWKGARINKGWAGHTIERHLGLPPNSLRSPDFGSWELKVVPVRAMPDGTFKVKEAFDLGDEELYEQIRAGYDLIRDVIRTKGFKHLSGSMGVMEQPRTKGQGHGSTSRAFYARTALVTRILGMGVRSK